MANDDPLHPMRTEGLEINVVDDGYVVHQPATERIHYLNHTAGFLLELCNGRYDQAALAGLLQQAYNLPTPPNAEVESGLRSLREQGLIR